ncbi:MAG TPA: maleylpyruvate isomerase family mycothiol-dependent enzyme [Acidimicrobiia bacterium]|nr:maleylpyruvate isomerase family mycothiol-dependent enzyme [Acidimicrobiia bacterium]
MERTPEQTMRATFARYLTEVGPDAPTLCEGWTAEDLAIHMVLIERHPEAWLGIPISDRITRTRGYFDGLVQHERDRPWGELVERVEVGPTRGPLANPTFRNHMMFREYTVHAEDVRRANDLPAADAGPDVRERTWGKAQAFARFVRTDGSHGLEIAEPGGRVHQVRKGATTARITGEPIELLLFAFGRTAVEVDVSGDPDAVAGVAVRAGGAGALPRPRLT